MRLRRPRKPLAVVPTYIAQARDMEVLDTCLRTLTATADCDVLVVDDASPAAALLEEYTADSSGVEFVFRSRNGGFSKAVNVGLVQAREEGRHAVLVNADIEFTEEGWLDRALAQPRSDDAGPAWVVGALLSYPNGLIQHGGIYYSNLHRTFEHIHKYAPENLPEAQTAKRCPVTGALQLIRHEALMEIGLYDEGFDLGWEDVDYCLSVFAAGQECVYQPRVRAVHYESLFRRGMNDRMRRSWIYFLSKHMAARTNLAEWVPAA